ncbi:Peptidase, M48 family [Desulfonema limicola]|uniref:Peptidase, M48 family n=1 Tax=Desulfonema limicola TaxID=45656 RepID=A0A975GFH2_9BACT|nr:M48 family metalloprotease [Desulfonema limicola]QTA79169.1 Peptidase, M48 family [Desulfonema limicola]
MKASNRRDFLTGGCRCILGLGLISPLSAILAGCESMGELASISANIAASSGLISDQQAQSIGTTAKTVAKTFEDITPEQEYYIGRTIGAVILSKYRPYNDNTVNRYINLLGQTLAKASELPETFGGYHFLALDSEDINAFAAPGGLIFVTRGLIRCCEHEDAMASVLAHEIGHVQFKHGLRAINTSRLTTALTTLGVEGAKTFGSQELASLTSAFEDSISDISQTMINTGYSRSLEYQADKAAAVIMEKTGYDPNGLVDMLKTMKTRLKPGSTDFFKTHPDPQARVKEIQKQIGKYKPVSMPETRQSRFKKALSRV